MLPSADPARAQGPATPAVEDPTDTDAPPRLSPVSVALWLSGLRCVATYLVLPFLAPVLGATIVVAIPIVLALYALGIGASASALWRSAQHERWWAAGFAGVLLALNLLSLITVVGQRLG